MTTIYLDIETIPAQRDDMRALAAEGVRPPGTLRKAESIAAWERDERPAAELAAVQATSFDGGLGQLVVIGWAIGNAASQSVQVATLGEDSEARALRAFFEDIRVVHDSHSGMRPVVVGHNVIDFDLRFLWRRAVVLGVRPPLWWPRDPKPWGDAAHDTMTLWAGARERISLDKLCRILGLEGKGDGPTGADVWPMVQAGRMDEVAAYCRADVDRVRAVYRRLTFAPVGAMTEQHADGVAA